MATAEQTKVSRKNKFLRALSENGGLVAQAAGAAGVSHTTMYNYRDEDEEFAAKWDVIQDINVERLEAEVDRRAVEGVPEPLMYKGEQVGTVQRYSDTLLMFRLKALRPEKYREIGAAKNRLPISEDELDEALQKMIARRTKSAKSTDVPEPTNAVN